MNRYLVYSFCETASVFTGLNRSINKQKSPPKLQNCEFIISKHSFVMLSTKNMVESHQMFSLNECIFIVYTALKLSKQVSGLSDPRHAPLSPK